MSRETCEAIEAALVQERAFALKRGGVVNMELHFSREQLRFLDNIDIQAGADAAEFPSWHVDAVGKDWTIYRILEGSRITGNVRAGFAIRCRRCGRVSHNIEDVKNKYCGNCHVFLDAMVFSPEQLARVTNKLTVEHVSDMIQTVPVQNLDRLMSAVLDGDPELAEAEAEEAAHGLPADSIEALEERAGQVVNISPFAAAVERCCREPIR